MLPFQSCFNFYNAKLSFFFLYFSYRNVSNKTCFLDLIRFSCPPYISIRFDFCNTNKIKASSLNDIVLLEVTSFLWPNHQYLKDFVNSVIFLWFSWLVSLYFSMFHKITEISFIYTLMSSSLSLLMNNVQQCITLPLYKELIKLTSILQKYTLYPS